MEMTSSQRLHYAFGELAYAMARMDGKVQQEEREKFHQAIEDALREHHYAYDISDIIFQLLDKDHADAETTYQWAMNEIRLNSHYLSPEMKYAFISVMKKIADAFPPVTKQEQQLLDRFLLDIIPVNGDPVFYRK